MEHEFHNELKQTTLTHILKFGYHAFTEFNLSGKYAADILVIGPAESILIFEIKVTYKAQDIEHSWKKYSPYCHGLYIVLPDAAVPLHDRDDGIFKWRDTSAATGIMTVKARQLTMIRQAIPRKMNTTMHAQVLQEARRRIAKSTEDSTSPRYKMQQETAQ